MIVLDTNVVSELLREPRAPAVQIWMREVQDERYTTAITMAEIRYGVARLPDGRRKTALAELAEETFSHFSSQVLSFDARCAGHYAHIVSGRERMGLPIGPLDAQIAAICREHNGSLATRNISDFVGTGLTLINPWQVEPDQG